MPSSYEEIIQSLDECLDERGDAIGPEPLLLLRHYRQLLAEDFMDQSEASKLARQIYLRHKRALDFILENKVDPIYEASNALEAALRRQAAALDIVVDRTVKGYVRFLPKEWDVPENSGGTGWGPNSRYLLCEVCLWTKKVELQITAGKAPDAWADLVWQRAAHAPFRQEWKVRPEKYVKPYKSKSDITVERLADLDEEEMANRLVDWLKDELAKDKFKEAVRVLAEFLPQLKGQ